MARVDDTALTSPNDVGSILLRAIDRVPAMVGCWNVELGNTFLNNACAERFGVDPELVRGAHIRDVLGEASYELNRQHVDAVLRGEVRQFQRAMIDSVGRIRTLHETYVPDTVGTEVVGFTSLAVDITDRVEAQRRHDDTLRTFRLAMENAPIGKAVLTTTGRWLQVNKALCELTGYSATELTGMTFRDITHPEDIEQGDAHMGALLRGAASELTSEKRYLRKDGTVIWVQRNAAVVRDEDGVDVVIAQVQDITRRKVAEAELARQAVTDDLTGLANRRYLMNEMAKSTETSPMGVVYVDVDEFKSVNDTWGHVAGDLALAEVGRRLAASVRESDVACRVGGDEFVVLVKGARTPDAVGALAERVKSSLSGEYVIADATMDVSVSVGWSWSDDDDADALRLLRDADRLMYRHKRGIGD